MTSPGGLLGRVLADLRAESDDLDARVADLPEADWRRSTPAEGWAVADTVGHLQQSDEMALTAITGDFDALLRQMAEVGMAVVDRQVEDVRWRTKEQTLQVWRDGRETLSAAIAEVEPGVKIPWFGPPMSAVSFATARLMETWAHGQDVADALGQERVPTDRLRHVAEIGFRTHVFAHLLRDEPAPGPVRVELTGPGGGTWGPSDAADRVTGTALDFCLLVTQRRHRSDTSLVAEGAGADHWLDVAQAFAGAPGNGRPPLDR